MIDRQVRESRIARMTIVLPHEPEALQLRIAELNSVEIVPLKRIRRTRPPGCVR